MSKFRGERGYRAILDDLYPGCPREGEELSEQQLYDFICAPYQRKKYTRTKKTTTPRMTRTKARHTVSIATQDNTPPNSPPLTYNNSQTVWITYEEVGRESEEERWEHGEEILSNSDMVGSSEVGYL